MQGKIFRGGYHLTPVTLKEAQDFENAHHRHNKAACGHKFSIGLADASGNLIGVCTVGRPIARYNDDGETAQITRVCVLDDYQNANSMLYGAACRACKAMGYKSVITYTLQTESGSSLKAAGFVVDSQVHGGSWDMPGRHRVTQQVSMFPKWRWRRIL